MINTKTKALTILFSFLSVRLCLAEGQTGLAEFYIIVYILTFIFYTVVGGGLILFIRSKIGLKNSRKVSILSFTLSFIAAIIFYLIDSFHFLPFFW